MKPIIRNVPKKVMDLHQKLSKLDPEAYNIERCEDLIKIIDKIKKLKKERNAVILAHNYQRPEIFEVADYIGDSLGLSKEAMNVKADIIVFCGVHFMAETAKILNPNKKVLLPNARAGCSLASSITADALAVKIYELKEKYPDLAVVCYVNTTADVKALCDACCTSSNALKIIENLPTDNILFVPDENLAAYVRKQTKKNIIAWNGNCYVHHQITPESILNAKKHLPNAKILAHPECRADVIKIADATLSTEGMVNYAKNSKAKEFVIVTECGLSDRLLLEVPEKLFYKTCNMCMYMKMIIIEEVLESLEKMKYEIKLPEQIRTDAEKSLLKMFDLTESKPISVGCE